MIVEVSGGESESRGGGEDPKYRARAGVIIRTHDREGR